MIRLLSGFPGHDSGAGLAAFQEAVSRSQVQTRLTRHTPMADPALGAQDSLSFLFGGGEFRRTGLAFKKRSRFDPGANGQRLLRRKRLAAERHLSGRHHLKQQTLQRLSRNHRGARLTALQDVVPRGERQAGLRRLAVVACQAFLFQDWLHVWLQNGAAWRSIRSSRSPQSGPLLSSSPPHDPFSTSLSSPLIQAA